jgi:hypothetical protein
MFMFAAGLHEADRLAAHFTILPPNTRPKSTGNERLSERELCDGWR